MNHGLTLIVREFGEVGCAHTLRVYKVFTKTGGGPWLRGASALGLPENKLHSTVCIVLLSEFVSWNAWLQHPLGHCLQMSTMIASITQYSKDLGMCDVSLMGPQTL